MSSEERTSLSLPQATEHLLEESRMVLPGMQALFGFQLIAVLNTSFSEKLDTFHQRLHLAAIALVIIAIAIIMTPAAYHRQTSPRAVSAHFVAASSRLIFISMVPLALAICIDFYIVAWIIERSEWAAILAAVLLVLFAYLWFVFPRAQHARNWLH
jgi:DMSO reductase anchor subunit